MSITIDPADYKAGSIKGKQRVFGGRFGNELGQSPWMSFDEEVVVVDETTGNVFRQPVGSISATFSDPSEVYDLRSPVDDSIIGSFTAEQFYAMMYSVGRKKQIDRDDVNAIV